MYKRIRYDDNIFFLSSMIRILLDAIKIKVDAEYFAQKIFEDIIFIDSSICRMYDSLKKNNNLINRKNHLHSILKLKHSYTILISTILNHNEDYAQAYASVRSQLTSLAASHRDDEHIIRKELSSDNSEHTNQEIISCDELDFLMQPMED